MEAWWMIAIVGAGLISSLYSLAVRRIAMRADVFDYPDGDRKKHEQPVPLLGGFALYGALVTVVGILLLVTDHFTSGEIGARQYIGVGLGGAVLMAGGILDDVYNLKPRTSILFPVLSALVVVAFGVGVEKVTNPFGGFLYLSEAVSSVLTFLWVLVVIYTMKLLDGVDGLVTGFGVIASVMIALLALSAAFFQPDVALLACLSAAVFIGFAIWNAPPALLYLGEGGSTFVGFIIAILAVISGSKVMTALIVLAVPAIDIAFVVLSRIRSGASPFTGDRRHLHHRLLSLGLKPWSVLCLYWGIAVAFGLTSLLLESWQKLVVLCILFVLTLAGATYLSRNV